MPAAAPEPGSMVLHESWRGRINMIVFLIACMGVLVTRADGVPHTAWLVLFVLLMLGEVLRVRRPVATLNEKMIVVHNMRPAEVSWHRISEIGTVKKLGSRRILLTIDDGSLVVMDGPTGTFLARDHFDATLAQVRRWWTERRGATRAADAPQPGTGDAPPS